VISSQPPRAIADNCSAMSASSGVLARTGVPTASVSGAAPPVLDIQRLLQVARDAPGPEVKAYVASLAQGSYEIGAAADPETNDT
jgi:hypothetical protein